MDEKDNHNKELRVVKEKVLIEYDLNLLDH